MTISVDQRLALLSTLGAHTDWDVLGKEQVQAGISGKADELDRIGREFTLFIRNGFRMQVEEYRETSEFTLEIPARPRPTLEELQKEYPWIKSIEDTSPEGPVRLKLITVLRPGESSIGGKEYEQRLVPIENDALGYQQLNWLIDNQDKVPAAVRGKFYIDFPGLVVVHGDGSRFVPFASRGGERWDRYWGWLGGDFGSDDRLALCGK